MINVAYIKQLMDKREITQQMLAVEMRVTESCVSRILNGKRQGSLEFLEGLARAFPDVDIRLFLKTDKPGAKGKAGP